MITSPRGSGSFRELPGAPDGLDLLVPLDQENAELRREKIFSEDSKHILKSLDMCNMSFKVVYIQSKPGQTESMLFLLFSTIASFMNGLRARMFLPQISTNIGAKDRANAMKPSTVLAHSRPR